VRVLVTSTPGLGHVLPMLPLVRELRARGHDVRWIGGQAISGDLRDAGVDVVEAGLSEGERMAQVASRLAGAAEVPAHERRLRVFPTAFAGLAVPAVLGVVQDEVERWSPDVVVHEAAELAAPLAAARAGIPSVSHGFGEVIPAMAMRGAGEVLAPAWRDAGLEPDPWAGSYRGMHVDIYPPSLRSEPMDHVADVQACRPAEGVPADGHRVYVSFGTLFNQPGELFRTAALAAAEVAEEVLVTVGPGVDPAALGPLPAHVQVEAFVPQAEVLPSCAAVVCHAGSGTVLAALAHGVPLVCLPQAADQFANAHNVARRGAGEVRTGPDLDHADVRDAVERVLRSPGPRAAAAEVAAEISTMPGTDEVASAIEARVRAA